jgi:hypothetical protein
MAKQTINVGLTANDRTGDPLRIAMQKTNSNFTEIYNFKETTETSITNLETSVANTATSITNLETSAANTATSITNLETSVSNLETAIENIEVTPTNELEYLEVTSRYTLGEPVSFTKVLGENEFDEIDNDLILTRVARPPGSVVGGGIYNSALESEWNATESPVGLLWNWDGWDNLDTVKQRQYVNLRQALKNRIGENIVGAELVAHDIINDKYYTFLFNQWDQGSQHDGGFAYTRTLIDVSNQIGVTFADGTNLVTIPEGFNRYPQTYIGDTSAYTMVLEDAGKHIYAFGVTITLPNRNEVDYPIGSVIKVVAENQPVVISPDSEVSISSATSFPEEDGSWIIPANAIATLIKTRQGTTSRPDVWRLSVPQTFATGNVRITIDDVTISSPEDENLFIKAGDDLYLDALGDDVFIRASDDIRLRTNYDFETDDYRWQFRFTSSGNQIFFNGDEDEEYGRIIPEAEDDIRGLTLEGSEQVRIRVSDTDQELVFNANGDLNTSGGINTFGIITTTDDIVLKESGSETARITTRLSDGFGLQVQASLDFEINVIGSEEETTIWSFESNGGIVFPDSTIQTTAFTGNSISNGGSSVNIPDEDSSVIVTVSANNEIATWQFEIGGDVPIIRTPSGAGSSIFNETLMQMSASSNDWYSDVVAQEGEVFIAVGNDGEGGGITFLGVSSSGASITSFGNSTSNLNVAGNITGNILQIEVGAHEKFQSKADATGVVEHDCRLGHIFYHTSPDANWTVNLTNLNLENNYATSVTIVIGQGGTGYYPSALQIDGVSQTINWQGNTTPTPSVNRTDVVTFSIINNGGTYIVLGQLTGF